MATQKHNRGGVGRPPYGRAPFNFGRVHNFIFVAVGLGLISDRAALFLTWADGLRSTWIPRVGRIQNLFGWDDKKWRRVRKELESLRVVATRHQCLHCAQQEEEEQEVQEEEVRTCQHGRNPPLVHTLDVDLVLLHALVLNHPNYPAKMPDRALARAQPGKNAGWVPGKNAGSCEPAKMPGYNTTSSTEQKHHNTGGGVGGQEQKQHGRQGGPLGAVAPSGAGGLGLGLGGLLRDVLHASLVAQVDVESVGASVEQLQFAAEAFRATLAAGKVRSAAALAGRLARRAARGEVTPPAAASGSGSGGAPPDPWPARAALAGSWVDHADGELYVEPGGKSWRRRGGNLVVGGASALRLWKRIEAGELALHS